MTKVIKGNKVKVHYTGTLNGGEKFDSSHDRGQTLDFQVGTGQMIKGFDQALLEMEVGQTKKINLKPTDAYGDMKPEAIQEVPKSTFPPNFELTEGGMVEGRTQSGQPMRATVKEVKESSVILDMNHPLAGKELNFEIELVEIEN